MSEKCDDQRAKRMSGYSLSRYMAAAGASLAVGAQADAAVNATPSANIQVNPGSVVDIDLNNDGLNDVRFGLNFNANNTSSFPSVQFTNTNIINATMRQRIFYRYDNTFRSTSSVGNAYAKMLRPNGLIATSNFLRNMPASSVVNASLLSSQAGSRGSIQAVNNSYYLRAATSQVLYYKQILNTAGAVVSSYTTNSRGGGGYFNQRSTQYSAGYFLGGRGFLAVQFDDAAGDPHYGWIELDLASMSQLTVVGWAYETDPGQEIQVGAVPEPSSLAVLACGAAGVLSMRRRRTQRGE